MVNCFICVVINRDEIAKLTLKAGWAPAIAILGPRQCGKTTLAKAFGALQSNGFIYLDLESPTDKAKLTDAESYFKVNEEKTKLFKSIDRSSSDQPIWAKRVIVNGPNFLAISPTEILNTANSIIEPVGIEKDAIKAWISRNIDLLVSEIRDENKIMCTVEDQVLKFAAFDVVDGHSSRIKRTKTISPKACPFFVQTALSALVKDCTGSDFPENVKTKEKQCIYLSLSVRSAYLARSPYVTWVSPEVWSFLSKESATIRSKLA